MENGEFEVFWSGVWLKVGKGAARRKFKIARKLATLEKLIEAAKNYTEWLTAEKRERKFWLHPATWLHNEHWDDDLISSKPPEAERTPIWGNSGFDPDAARRECELEKKRTSDAVEWLEQRPECDVDAAFVCVKDHKGMSGLSIFNGSTWRQFPVWTAEAMGWDDGK